MRHGLNLVEDPPRDSDGLIQWPRDAVGSVSHSMGHVALAIAESATHAAIPMKSIGLDLESANRMRLELAPKICTASELKMLQAGEVTLVDIFAAKEALFKAHFPLGRKRFWFLDAEVVDPPAGDSLRLRILTDTGPETPAGHETLVELFVPAQIPAARMAVACLF